MFKQRCVAERRTCSFCGGGIDYSLAAGHPQAFEVHHDPPVSELIATGRGNQVLDMRLWLPSHALTNG